MQKIDRTWTGTCWASPAHRANTGDIILIRRGAAPWNGHVPSALMGSLDVAKNCFGDAAVHIVASDEVWQAAASEKEVREGALLGGLVSAALLEELKRHPFDVVLATAFAVHGALREEMWAIPTHLRLREAALNAARRFGAERIRELADARLSLDSIQGHIAQCDAELEELDSELDTEVEELRKAESELAALKDVIREQASAVEEVREAISERETERRTALGERDALSEQIDAISKLAQLATDFAD